MARTVTRGTGVAVGSIPKKKQKIESTSTHVAHTVPKDGIPTLWGGRFVKRTELPFFYYPNPDVTPELAEDSDVEVSAPTLNYFLNRGGFRPLLLHSHPRNKGHSAHRLRRLMFGNSRLVLEAEILRTKIPHSIMNWYSQAAGFTYNDLNPNSDQSVRVPAVDAGRLLEMTGVYIFCPAKGKGHPPSLRFLRAPVDFSHNCDTAALYGLTNEDCMITRTSDWSLISAWKSHDCSHIRFMNEKKADEVDGDWNAMAVIDIPTAETLKGEIEKEIKS